MVVKDRVGRRRYIILENSPRVDGLLRRIREVDDRAKIVYRDSNFILLRCRHWYKDKVLKILWDNGIKTYRTTGTIRKAKRIMKGIRI